MNWLSTWVAFIAITSLIFTAALYLEAQGKSNVWLFCKKYAVKDVDELHCNMTPVNFLTLKSHTPLLEALEVWIADAFYFLVIMIICHVSCNFSGLPL